MKRWMWLSVALAVTMTFAAFAAVAPLGSAASPTHPAAAVDPAATPVWNTGNLCTSLTTGSMGGETYITCIGDQSDQNVWWNFSTPEDTVLQVTEQGSNDCINLNFASFYNTILLTLQGSNYHCSGTAGVNIVINSEGDTVIFTQEASNYHVNTYLYSFTVNYNVILEGSFVVDKVYFIGVNGGLGSASQVCPFGVTNGLPPDNRIAIRSTIALGSYDTLSTIWVDASGPTVAPYSIAWVAAINGFGVYDYLGYQVTNSPPAAGCSYLLA